MAINKNRHQESLSTVKAAKKGTQTLGKSSSTKADKFLSEEQVQGGRETTDKNEWREARNASMKGSVTNPNGGNSSKSKETTNANSSSTSSTSNNKEQSAPVAKAKPTLKQIKKRVKPQPSIEDLIRRTPEYKYSVEKAKIKSEHARSLGGSDGASITLMDILVTEKAEEMTLSDSRLKKIAKQYGVDIDDVFDTNRDGVINETDISIIANNQQSNPRQQLATSSVAPQEVEQETEVTSEPEQQPEQSQPQTDIFDDVAGMARSYFGK